MTFISIDINQFILYVFKGEHSIIAAKLNSVDFWDTWFIHTKQNSTGYDFLLTICQHSGFCSYHSIEDTSNFSFWWKDAKNPIVSGYTIGVKQNIHPMMGYRIATALNLIGIEMIE